MNETNTLGVRKKPIQNLMEDLKTIVGPDIKKKPRSNFLKNTKFLKDF